MKLTSDKLWESPIAKAEAHLAGRPMPLGKSLKKNKVHKNMLLTTEKEHSPLSLFIGEAITFASQIQMFHLNAKTLAEHNALDGFYQKFPALVDCLGEAHLAECSDKLEIQDKSFSNAYDLLCYICKMTEELKPCCLDSVLDEMHVLSKLTKYKLKLK